MSWLRLAVEPVVLRRSLTMCLVVGTLLVLINHGPALSAGSMTPPSLVQILLTYLVPFVVSTVSSVATLKNGSGDSAAGGRQ